MGSVCGLLDKFSPNTQGGQDKGQREADWGDTHRKTTAAARVIRGCQTLLLLAAQAARGPACLSQRQSDTARTCGPPHTWRRGSAVVRRPRSEERRVGKE